MIEIAMRLFQQSIQLWSALKNDDDAFLKTHNIDRERAPDIGISLSNALATEGYEMYIGYEEHTLEEASDGTVIARLHFMLLPRIRTNDTPTADMVINQSFTEEKFAEFKTFAPKLLRREAINESLHTISYEEQKALLKSIGISPTGP